MSSIDQVFRELSAAGRKAIVPFVTAGDPDLLFTETVLAELVRRGISLCELGIPYSDPIADGPVIQASYTRAMQGGFKLHDTLSWLSGVTPHLGVPLVTMVSYSIVYRQGLERYVADARAAGVAGAIVPDLPIDEAAELAAICRKQDFSLIQLVAPTTTKDRALRIAETSTGFLYYVSVTGITGERQELPDSLVDNLSWLRQHTQLPICVGFGISRPKHVRMLAPVADGFIVGSAVMRRIAEVRIKSRDVVVREVGEFVETLVRAL